jgi:uncharacterized protein (TIGR02996 family)
VSDHDALLRAIVENPAEDTPRLAFADWLDEHADAFPTPAAVRLRAAFVRDDISFARLDEYDPARLRWELIEKPRREAEGWVDTTLPPGVSRAHLDGPPLFRRGFPWGLRSTPDEFLAGADRVLAALPIGVLSFFGHFASTDRLLRSPHMARLTGLRVRGANLSPRSVRALAASTRAGAFEELDVSGGGLSAAAYPWFARSLLPLLVRVGLGGTAWATPALRRDFVQAPACPRLREVVLDGSGLFGPYEPVLGAAPLRGVERLSLAGCRLRHSALYRADLPHLRDLDLSETAPGSGGLRQLAASPVLARLRRLAFRRNHASADHFAEFAACPGAAGLRALDLASNAIGNAGAAAVAGSPHLAGLRVLNLAYCMVGDEGIVALLESPLADSLVLLDLTGSPASAETKELLKARMGDRVRV